MGGPGTTVRNLPTRSSTAIDSTSTTSVITSTIDSDLGPYISEVLAKLNLTQRDYDEMLISDRERVNTYANALRGFENGSLTQAEASALSMPNSPLTVFAPGDILQFLDILHWWGYFYEFPTSFSVGRHDDEVFQIDFISRAMVGERICNRWVYWDKNPTLYSWSGYQMVNKWKGIATQYTSWQKPSTAEPMSVSRIHELIIWTGSYRASAPTHFVGDIKIIFRYQYQWWDIWKNWPWGGWQNAECIYSIDRYWPALWPNLNLNDDDTNAPEISDAYVFNEVEDDSAQIPYIYDTTGVLKIAGEALEGFVYPYEKASGISNIAIAIDGAPVIYSWSASTSHYVDPDKSLDYRYSFAVFVPDPALQLGLGIHTATICVFDGDTDRDSDSLSSPPRTLTFEIKEELIDTAPPHTTPDIDGILGGEGWYTSDVCLSLLAEDDLSGIETTWYSYDEVIWTEYISPLLITNEGATTIFYCSTDFEGNEEQIDSTTIKIDKTSPTTTFNSEGTCGNEGWYVSDVMVSMSSGDDGSGVEHMYCRINEGAWLEYQEPFWLRTTGTYSIEYYSIDKAGNEESVKNYVLKIDQDPPETLILIEGTQGLGDWFTSEIQVTLESDDSPVGSGVQYTYYSINGGSWVLYTGTFTVDLEGIYSIGYYSIDLVGNVENELYESVAIDTIAPETTIAYSGTPGLNDWYLSDVVVSLFCDDGSVGSGPNVTYYSINQGTWNLYTESFLIEEDGMYTIDFYSIDMAGNSEFVNSASLLIDTQSPSSSLEYSPSLGIDPIFVTSDTMFHIDTTDTISGIAHTYYSINSGPWAELQDAFNIDGPDGEYTISYYSVDVAGNEEAKQTLVVYLTSIQIQTHLEDGDLNEILSFDNIFTKDKDSGGYILVATNPGQIFYSIEIKNNWPTTVNSLHLQLCIPEDFILKGSVPIHLYMDGIDITCQCVIDENMITVNEIPPDAELLIIVHLDYNLKGCVYNSLEEFGMKNYEFFTEINAISQSLIGSYDSSSDLIAAQKKTTAIAGYVRDVNGNPLCGVIVEIFDSLGNKVKITTTDENGFYYFIDLEVGFYIVKIIDDSSIITIEVATIKNEMTIVDCYI